MKQLKHEGEQVLDQAPDMATTDNPLTEHTLSAITVATDTLTTGNKMSNIPTTADDFHEPAPNELTAPLRSASSVEQAPQLSSSVETFADDHASLAMLLDELHTTLSMRADRHQVQMFHFCLHHLFYNSSRLYQRLLPEFTLWISQQKSHHTPAYTCGLWSNIQAIGCILERLENLCQLLNGTICDLLDALDRTCSIFRCRQDHPSEDNVDQQRETALWQRTDQQINLTLRGWGQANQQRLRFSTCLADQQEHSPALEQIDTALDHLQEQVQIIFGGILPNLQRTPPDDDDKTALLLLDIQQRTDQLLFQIDLLLEPLHQLIKRYAPGQMIE